MLGSVLWTQSQTQTEIENDGHKTNKQKIRTTKSQDQSDCATCACSEFCGSVITVMSLWICDATTEQVSNHQTIVQLLSGWADALRLVWEEGFLTIFVFSKFVRHKWQLFRIRVCTHNEQSTLSLISVVGLPSVQIHHRDICRQCRLIVDINSCLPVYSSRRRSKSFFQQYQCQIGSDCRFCVFWLRCRWTKTYRCNMHVRHTCKIPKNRLKTLTSEQVRVYVFKFMNECARH